MPLRYSCFISYRHTQVDLVQGLVSSLKAELSRWLDLDIYVDTRRLDGGDFFNTELRKALCESACFIVVYTPTYFSKQNSYCAREYRAMEILEEERLSKLEAVGRKQYGLIIPIVYRGEKTLPKTIRDKRQYYLFETFQIGGSDNLNNQEYAKKIKEIAEYIAERCEELQLIEDDISTFCETFVFPKEGEISDWLENMLPPKPMFPGREAF